jgi:2-heptyl-3-hydroxy-4(1H)-quinolone synthase
VRILIVGGGIGGLTLAAALKVRGIHADVVERAAAWMPIGAGIVLGLNAMKVLGRIGLAGSVARRGIEVGVARVTDARGETLSALDFRALPNDIGRAIALHRASLHDGLLTGVDPASIRLNTTVKAIDQDALRVSVQLSDGTRHEYDAVIGADGIRSVVRWLTFGETPLRYSGYTCWRFVARGEFTNADTWEMWGRGRRFGIVPLGGDKVYCFTTLNAPQNDPTKRNIALDDFKKLFAEFQGPAPELLASLKTADQLIWNDLEEICLDTWVKGRVALLGDAAHAMTPNMGQGAAMAIEDAFVLADELAHQHDISAALTRYEQRRRKRVDFIQTRSRRIGVVAQWQSSPACTIRNFVARLTPDSFSTNAVKQLALAEL